MNFVLYTDFKYFKILINYSNLLLLFSCKVLSESFVRLLCGISQARVLEWVAISFSRGSFPPKDQTRISCFSCVGRQILYCVIWEAQYCVLLLNSFLHSSCVYNIQAILLNSSYKTYFFSSWIFLESSMSPTLASKTYLCPDL